MKKVKQYEVVVGVDDKEYVFFYGGPFSQWARTPFTAGHFTYNCAEQYMMAEKARLFRDEETLRKILNSDTASQQKKLGRQVKGFSQSTWEKYAQSIVYEANLAKFHENKKERDLLLSTGDATIVEASPYDFIWGIGMGIDNEYILNPSKWEGKNWLGKTLVLVRNHFRFYENEFGKLMSGTTTLEGEIIMCDGKPIGQIKHD